MLDICRQESRAEELKGSSGAGPRTAGCSIPCPDSSLVVTPQLTLWLICVSAQRSSHGKNVSVFPDVFEEALCLYLCPLSLLLSLQWLHHPFRLPSGIHGHS